MTRISVGSGMWFDDDKAERFANLRRFDGHNMISVATGSQWESELLYRTKGGRWVLEHSGNNKTSYSLPDNENEDVRRWLIENDHMPTADLYFPKETAAGEL